MLLLEDIILGSSNGKMHGHRLIGFEDTKPKISHFLELKNGIMWSTEYYCKMENDLTKEMWGNGQTPLSFILND